MSFVQTRSFGVHIPHILGLAVLKNYEKWSILGEIWVSLQFLLVCFGKNSLPNVLKLSENYQRYLKSSKTLSFTSARRVPYSLSGFLTPTQSWSVTATRRPFKESVLSPQPTWFFDQKNPRYKRFIS